MARILIVDDEAAIRKALERFLSGLKYEVLSADNGETALELASKDPIDLALIDLVMPKMDGIELITRLKKIQPDLIPIVLTGFGTITSAVEAMRVGAYHYLTKPFELDDIASLIATALDHRMLKEENRLLKSQLLDRHRFENIIGTSDEMAAVFDMVEKVANTDSTVLITGESGTGKELIAKAIHYNSTRRDKPLITVNCAAIPEELLESELFGHIKGAFTGAVATHPGKFDAADGGSIFLDEIGDMSFKLQVKVLRVLQEQRFEPVGSSTTREVDVRIIAATNQDLERAVKERRFREDLFYRLNVIPIHVPPLRERVSDIPLLISHFIRKYNAANDRKVTDITQEALTKLCGYQWPGNVRELENTIERIIVLKKGEVIDVADLPPTTFEMSSLESISPDEKSLTEEEPAIGPSFKKCVAEYEAKLIKLALQRAGGNKNKAAALLKLNRTTLVEKMKKRNVEGIR